MQRLFIMMLGSLKHAGTKGSKTTLLATIKSIFSGAFIILLTTASNPITGYERAGMLVTWILSLTCSYLQGKYTKDENPQPN